MAVIDRGIKDNPKTGDSLYDGAGKINDKFNEVDTAVALRTIGWAASQAATDIVVGNTDDFFVKYDFTLVTYWCGLSDPPTGSSATFDLLKNGVSITSTKATIAASAYNSLTGTQPVLTTTTFVKGDRIMPVISSIGSLNTGQSLKVYLEIIKS